MGKKKLVRNIIHGVLIGLIGLMLVYNVYMLVARFAFHIGMPTVFGISAATVGSDSMKPEFETGDLVINRAQDDYAIGDVITYYSPWENRYITHRIVEINHDGSYTTWGIANVNPNGSQAIDQNPVPKENVVGKVVSVLHGVGNVVEFIKSPAGLCTIAAVGVVLWLAVDLLTGAFHREKDEDERKD